MVFNATFNNISVISWWSGLLMEETEAPGESHRPVASHWQSLSQNVVHLTLIEIPTHNIFEFWNFWRILTILQPWYMYWFTIRYIFFFYPKWLIKWKYRKYHIPHCRNSSNMQYIANSSCHWGSYGSIWTGTSPNKYYVDRSFWGPYNIFLVTDRSIYCRMTRSDMNYLLYYTFYLK